MYSLVLIIPFISFISVFFFGHLIGCKGSSFLSGFYSILLWVVVMYCLFDITFNLTTVEISIFRWFSSGSLVIDWAFIFDPLSVTMLLLVSSVSMVVQLYSLEYMSDDPYKSRFLSYLSLFLFCMILLVLASNLAVLIVGWEGVGICSFLLISFWNKRVSAIKAAIKAIIFNRIGDMGFFIGVALIAVHIQSLDFHIIYIYGPYLSNCIVFEISENYIINLLDIIFFFLVFGVLGKSAQLGLHVWLLDAMEGPTPVSALIHAATMVTAGIFMLIRLSFILDHTNCIKIVIALLGVCTALLASVIGAVQNDLKSIIAYSTCSQLGYMVAMCGVSSYTAAFFHLINHGFFKALLFLSAGVIIHNFNEEQDIRKMGSLFSCFPLTYIFFISGSLSLLGLPFLSGYYSKDFIIEFLSILPFNWCNFLYQVGFASIFFSSFYSIRLIFYVFISNPNANRNYYNKTSEQFTTEMLFGLSILFIGTLFSGAFLFDMFLGTGSFFFSTSVSQLSLTARIEGFNEFFFLEHVHSVIVFKMYAFILIALSCLSFIITIFIKWKAFKHLVSNKLFNFMYVFLYNGFFFNYVLIKKICYKWLKFSWKCFLSEKMFIEYYGPVKLNEIFIQSSLALSTTYANKSYSSIFYLTVFSIVSVLILFLI